MQVRKIDAADAAELRRLKQDLEEARRAFKDKCAEIAPHETFSEDFEYAVKETK